MLVFPYRFCRIFVVVAAAVARLKGDRLTVTSHLAAVTFFA